VGQKRGKQKQQANKIFAIKMDFCRRFTRKANSLSNTFTATMDVGKIIFEATE
jgi:hypothetical protein